jgi:hypothetical protein
VNLINKDEGEYSPVNLSSIGLMKYVADNRQSSERSSNRNRRCHLRGKEEVTALNEKDRLHLEEINKFVMMVRTFSLWTLC